MYGGFECNDWAYTGPTGAPATLAPSTQGVALTLTSLTSALFVDLEIDAQSAPQTQPDAGSASGRVEHRHRRSERLDGRRIPENEDCRGQRSAGRGRGTRGSIRSRRRRRFKETMRMAARAVPAKAFMCPGGLTTTGGKGGDSPAGTQ